MIPVRFNTLNDLGKFFSEAQRGWAGDESGGTWSPAVDIYERGEDLVFRVEVPGVKKEDLEISVENGVLQLKGQRKREQEFRDENAYRIERSYGTFTRSFSLPTTVDPSRVTAQYRDGELEVVLPKSDAAKPKRIEVKAA
jgi:HSP20 family protein